MYLSFPEGKAFPKQVWWKKGCSLEPKFGLFPKDLWNMHWGKYYQAGLGPGCLPDMYPAPCMWVYEYQAVWGCRLLLRNWPLGSGQDWALFFYSLWVGFHNDISPTLQECQIPQYFIYVACWCLYIFILISLYPLLTQSFSGQHSNI